MVEQLFSRTEQQLIVDPLPPQPPQLQMQRCYKFGFCQPGEGTDHSRRYQPSESCGQRHCQPGRSRPLPCVPDFPTFQRDKTRRIQYIHEQESSRVNGLRVFIHLDVLLTFISLRGLFSFRPHGTQPNTGATPHGQHAASGTNV